MNKPSPRLAGALTIAAIDIARQLAKAHAANSSRHVERARITNALHEAENAVRTRIPWHRREPWYVQHRPSIITAGALGIIVGVIAAAASFGRRVEGRAPVWDRMHDAVSDEWTQSKDSPRAAKIVQATGTAVSSAIGAAAADTAAAGTAGKLAVVEVTKNAVSERVTKPAAKKATKFGAIAAVGLTVYIVLVASSVALLVQWLG